MGADSCSTRIVHLDKVHRARLHDLDEREVTALCRMFKVCADQGRLRIVNALSFQEMCVCDLAALLEVSESAMSHQLRKLRTMGLVTNRRAGSVLYYRLTDDRLSRLIGDLRRVLLTEQGDDKEV